MTQSKKILIIGPFPNPISGVSIANNVVYDILDNSSLYKVKKINTSYPIFREDIGKFSLKKTFFYLFLNLNFLKIIKSKVVYITPGQTFFGLLKYSFFIILSATLKKELILHLHGNHLGKEYESLKGVKKKLFSFLIKKFTKGIVLSESLKHNLTPFLEDKAIFSLPNFAEEYLYVNDCPYNFDELRIVYLSNLMKEKGILELLKALRNLEKKGITYKAKLAGSIDEANAEKIKKYLEELNSTSYLGIVKGVEKKDLLNWSNVFVLPTFYKMEGQPISILEAMATRNLVITTNHAGIPDIVKNKLNGFFVEKEDDKSITEILTYLANNKNKIQKIAIHNKEYFLNSFTVEKFKEKLIQIIQ